MRESNAIYFEVSKPWESLEESAVGAGNETGVSVAMRHQHQRQLTHVFVERVEAQVKVAVDCLTQVLGQGNGSVVPREEKVWKYMGG